MEKEISFRGVTPSERLEGHIRSKIEKLERLGRIIDCSVLVEQRHHPQRAANRFNVRLRVTVPGGEVAVTNDADDEPAHEDVYAAVNDAFTTAKRRLVEHAERRRAH